MVVVSEQRDKQELRKRVPNETPKVDFGSQQPGTDRPMPSPVRKQYEDRIRSAVDSQVSSAAIAASIFIK